MTTLDRIRGSSHATKVILFLGTILLVVALTGVLRADRGMNLTKHEAVTVARTVVDFEPEDTRVRIVRRGFSSVPFWAVSFSIRDEAGGFERLTTVLVNAVNGEISQVTREH